MSDADEKYERINRSVGWHELQTVVDGKWKWAVLWWSGKAWLTADGHDLPYIGKVRDVRTLVNDWTG